MAALRQAIVTGAPLAKGINPFSILVSDACASEQLRCARQWALHKGFVPAAVDRVEPTADRTARRLRVGYLSSDFHEHATAYLMAGVLDAHDRRGFEIIAYSYGRPDASPMRRRLQSACAHSSTSPIVRIGMRPPGSGPTASTFSLT